MRRRAFAFVILLISVFALLSPAALAVAPGDWDKSRPGVLEAGHLYSKAAVLIDFETGDVLFDKNAEARMYPASTTKMMTLLLALESDIPLGRVITIPDAAKNIPDHSSLVPVFPGEQMTFQDLLYGVTINSGNDGSNAIAVLVGGSIEAFVQRMNERAAEIGCTDTHFSNAHGYHDATHYTTAMDLAKIARVAMRNETFRAIVAAKSYTLAPTVNRKELTLPTRVNLMMSGDRYFYEWCIGIKTGYTDKAGQCFVGAAERDGVTLISVVLNSAPSVTTQKWSDTGKLFEYGFEQYDRYLLMELYDLAGRDLNAITIENAAKDDAMKGSLSLRMTQVSDSDYARRVRKGDRALGEAVADFKARTTVALNEGLRAPIEEGEIVGTLTYASREGDTLTAMLTADRAIEARPEYATVYDVLPFLKPMEPFFSSGWATYTLIAVAALVAVLIVFSARRRARKNRRRQRIYELKRREYNRVEAERRREEMRRRAARRRRPAPRGRPAPRPQGHSARRRSRETDYFN
ncbi:MAG: D-alanyl-D-alanine carboxypeptidase [Clostridiales bacterium]|nr:D-alanyl-D-alanine carboxypeptidase [Clostridiales bacterium]